MARRWTAVLAGLLLVMAGCLGTGSEPVSDSSEDEAPDDGSDRSPEEEGSPEAGSNTSEGSDEASGDQASNGTEDSSDDADGEADEDDEAQRSWPDAANASIRPGVQVTGTGQCTSNFLFRTPNNATLMLGAAAHCFAEAPQTGSSGCREEVDPMKPGAEVEIENASEPGILVYSSWHTMQAANVTDETVCRQNDFALVAIAPADRPEVHPAVKEIGGPTGLAGEIAVGDDVEWYGQTSATPNSQATNRHTGKVVSSANWSFQAYSALPGVPGDSGSGVMAADGAAAGVLVTVESVYPAANGVTKLAPALGFAQDRGFAVELVTWDTFSGTLE